MIDVYGNFFYPQTQAGINYFGNAIFYSSTSIGSGRFIGDGWYINHFYGAKIAHENILIDMVE